MPGDPLSHALSTPATDATTKTTTTSVFDPYSVSASRQQSSLLDHEDDGDSSTCSVPRKASVPGVAGFLEMEDEPPRTPERVAPSVAPSSSVQIQTKSGLVLTHRRTSTVARPPETAAAATTGRLEYEHAAYAPRNAQSSGSRDSLLLNKLLSYVQLWVVLSAVVLFFGTAMVWHHMQSEQAREDSTSSWQSSDYTNYGSSSIRIVAMDEAQMRAKDIAQAQQQHTVILRPLPISETETHQSQQQQHNNNNNNNHHRHLHTSQQHHLWPAFQAWTQQHNRKYASQEATMQRFGIWIDNHHKTRAKNEQHGPCKLTGQPVFGSTQFQDLTQQEFQAQFLNANNSTRRRLQQHQPHQKEEHQQTLPVMGQHGQDGPNHHPEIRRRIQQRYVKSSSSSSSSSSAEAIASNKRTSNFRNCGTFDISCYLKYFFEVYIYGFGATMEPAYDADSYPMAWDWRDYGVVTDVHSQGSCGACWAITATETVESAVALSTGKLNDLSEHEVIVCTEECQMCSGGWPQDALDYVMDNNGIPLEKDLGYNADLLLTLTQALEGDTDAVDDNYLQSYRQEICPNGGGGNGHSGDNKNDGGGGGSTSFARYGGEIKGYGYATDKCVCYTDGSGCNCDSQNEGLAVRNLATYGPAIVCVDASLWQDYTGGIITSDSGCSSAFMDVNHCVQAVGYAFTTANSENNNNEGGGEQGGGKDNNRDSGDSGRIGYWIIRNQWSNYFGMSGYAYVAMGDNTCGVLNDMIQVYT